MLHDDFDFPVFSIQSNYYEEQIKILTNLKAELDSINMELELLKKEISNIGSKLNLYINNALDLDKTFDYNKHFLFFNEDKELIIYNTKQLEEYLNKIEDDSNFCFSTDCEIKNTFLNVLKASNQAQKVYKLNNRQYKRCMELSNFFKDTLLEYEFTLIDIEDGVHEYNYRMQEVKNDLQNNTFYELRDMNSDSDFETFNGLKHELLLTKNGDTSQWEFVYIKKEDVDKFIEYVNKEGN